MKGIRYGGFLYKIIDRYCETDHETNKVLGIIDYKSFTFTFKDNNPVKFITKEEYKELTPRPHFILYHDIDWRLFVFGNCDIYVAKKGRKALCESNNASLFDYTNFENALVGQSGWDNEKERFDIKRVVVLQFE